MARPNKKHSEFVALRIEKKLFDQIKKEAQENGTTISEAMRRMIRFALQERNKFYESRKNF